MNAGTSTQRSVESGPLGLLCRYGVYAAVIVLTLLLLRHHGRHGYACLFREHGPVETAQQYVLLATGLALTLSAWRHPACRQLSFLLATLVLLAAVRELDLVLDRNIPVLGWKIGYLAPLWAAVGLCRPPRRAPFLRQLRAFAGSQSFVIFWAAFIVAVPLAQMLGNGRLLEGLLGPAYTRDFKCVIEEVLELAGYLLLFMGSLELERWCRKPAWLTPAGA